MTTEQKLKAVEMRLNVALILNAKNVGTEKFLKVR